MKNNSGLGTTVKLCPGHDIARTGDKLRADSHSSGALNELEQPADEDTPRPIELIELATENQPGSRIPHASDGASDDF